MSELMQRWLSVALVGALGLTAAAQGAAAKKPDPKVKKKLEQLESAVADKKFTRDGEAVQLIDDLVQRYPSMHSKDQSALVRELEKVFRVRKREPDNLSLYQNTCKALGQIGRLGGKSASRILLSTYDKKPFSDREYVSLQEVILENIGVTQDERQIKFLVDRAVRDPEDRIKAAAGKALRHYDKIDLKKRKHDIFKLLLRNYAKIEGGSKDNLHPGDAVVETRRRTLRTIQDPWNTTLAALSGQNFRTAEEWQRWWNKNKNKNWDKT